MKLKVFDLNEISSNLTHPYSPKDIETIHETILRVARFDGEYHWHKHTEEDEFFLVLEGKIMIKTKKKDILLDQGQGVKIPRGVEHCPVSIKPSIVLMIEPVDLKSKGG